MNPLQALKAGLTKKLQRLGASVTEEEAGCALLDLLYSGGTGSIWNVAERAENSPIIVIMHCHIALVSANMVFYAMHW